MTREEDIVLLRRPRPIGRDDDLAAARTIAQEAAASAQVDVREVSTIEDLAAVIALFGGIWGRQMGPPVTIEMLRALAKAGNYVSAAFDGPDMVAACVGFYTAPAEGALHSHIAGVSGTVVGRNIGFALKLHQRAWALQHGLGDITWTFDPLVRRNAHFNLVKLAAHAEEYLPNFYGAMYDSINGLDDTDRLLVRWSLLDADVVAACARTHAVPSPTHEQAHEPVVALGISELGGPVPGRIEGPISLVAVPPDIEMMRLADPDLAHEWRLALRETLTTLVAGGSRISGFDRTGWYVVSRPTEGATS